VPAEQWRGAMASLNRPPHLMPTAALRGLSCPTLFLVGEEDPIVPAAVMHELSALARRGGPAGLRACHA